MRRKDAVRLAAGAGAAAPELDADGFRRATVLLRRLGALAPTRSWKYLASARGSVLWAVIFGVRMGYRSIVLCGVDLTGVTYFFEDPDAPLRVPGAPIPTNTQPGTIHKTADPTRPGATMPQLLETMRDEVLDPTLEYQPAGKRVADRFETKSRKGGKLRLALDRLERESADSWSIAGSFEATDMQPGVLAKGLAGQTLPRASGRFDITELHVRAQ